MAVYSEPRNEKEILNEIDGKSNVFLIGCPGCININFYLQGNRNLPLYKIIPFGIFPIYTELETQRMKKLLQVNNCHVEWWVPPYPNYLCTLSRPNRKKLLKKAKGADVVIVLGCDGGKANIENILSETGKKKIVCTMITKGICTLRIEVNYLLGRVYGYREATKIIEFNNTQ